MSSADFGAITAVRKRMYVPRAEIKLHNHFLAEVFDARTGRKQQQAEAENVVLNQGLRELGRLGSPGDRSNLYRGWGIMGGCGVGTGSTTPAPTDAGLETQVASAAIAANGQVANNYSFLADPANGIWYIRKRYVFSETVANYSLAEVGLARQLGDFGSSANNSVYTGTFFSRALFRDANGNPITVTKDGTQIMVVTATVYLTRGAVDSGMALLDGALNRFVRYDANLQEDQDNHMLESGWALGDGTSLANSDTDLSGAKLAEKEFASSSANSQRNDLLWTGSGWLQDNHPNWPSADQVKTTYAMDWELGEGNVTYSEILVSVNDAGRYAPGAYPEDSTVHIVFPCGTVSSSTSTKDNTTKRRMYFEIVWGS